MKDLKNAQNKKIKEAVLEIHPNTRNKTKVKLYKKLMRLRRTWAKDLNISKEEMRSIIIEELGTYCPYCEEKITARNISLDHITPLDRGGTSSPANAQIICSKCNKRKDILTEKEYRKLIRFLNKEFCEKARKIVLKQMSMKVYYGS